MPACQSWRGHIPTASRHTRQISQISPATLIPVAQGLTKLVIYGHRIVQRCQGRIAVPERAEYIDELFDTFAPVRVVDRDTQTRKSAPSRDLIEDGFQQTAPRPELVVYGESRDPRRSRNGVQREAGDAPVSKQGLGRLNHPFSLLSCRGRSNFTDILSLRHLSPLASRLAVSIYNQYS
jgi:hypothetical protein